MKSQNLGTIVFNDLERKNGHRALDGFLKIEILESGGKKCPTDVSPTSTKLNLAKGERSGIRRAVGFRHIGAGNGDTTEVTGNRNPSLPAGYQRDT